MFAADLHPRLVVSHPDWAGGERVLVLDTRCSGAWVSVRYQDVRAHHPASLAIVPVEFEVEPDTTDRSGAR